MADFKTVLFLADCAHGALCGARSAADANFGIYLEFIRTLTDCADGAGSLTATARNALRTDFVSHNTYLLVKKERRKNFIFTDW